MTATGTPPVPAHDDAPDGNGNHEWQLAELVDAIAAEIDHAEDTLALKSYARGISFAIKQLALELEVAVRRDELGRILFRTVGLEQPSATVLKLDFAQMLQTQLEGLRRPLDRPADRRPLSTLPTITDDEVVRLGAIGIYSVDDLERYTQSASMVAEVSRKTGIADPRIRRWRGLPYLTDARPPTGPSGSTVILEGGNLGAEPAPDAAVLFAGRPAQVDEWSSSRLVVRVPTATESGFVFVVAHGDVTNQLSWEVTGVDLYVRDILVEPAQPMADEPLTLQAQLVNRGTATSESFLVRWSVDAEPGASQPHGPLGPGQESQYSAVRLHLPDGLPAGAHTVRFTADPEHALPDTDPSNSTFATTVQTLPARTIVMGSSSPIERIDPLIYHDPGPLGVVSLIFRGLGGWDPSTGSLVPDVATEFIWERRDDRVLLTCPIRQDVTFHDGTPLTAEDVAYTYQCAATNQLGPPTVEGASVRFAPSSEKVSPDLLRIGIVPRHLRERDPQGFRAHPVGSGPFAVVELSPPAVRLRAHQQFVHGAPRLDRLSIIFVNEDEELFRLLRTGEVAVASLRYSKDLQVTLEEQGFRVVVLPGPDPEYPDYFTTMHAQATSVRERDPGAANPNWNANLWHLG